MSDADRERWNRRYAAGEYASRTHPTGLLEQWLEQVPRGAALDLACGAGRNARFLASQGFQVDAVDISSVALERAAKDAHAAGVAVNWVCQDLELAPLPDGPYNLIIVSRFLQRSLAPQIVEALSPDGWLVYEQHVVTSEPDVGGPSNPDFRLHEQELAALFAGLRIRFYREGLVTDPDGRRMALAQLVATAPTAHPSATDPSST
ncbi:MAG: class I SAM-dependent methyltransferase [Pseudomonadota bacterium]